mmetsp:Transcript_57153/g.65175  ORF Transcript_57153/g.65175 Transcript_57153/m.65175 type:complete len:217 (+) Transcript_57153:41-691(+)|eukprot:CAMPEP_0114986870 /NCGR_PEP_ID=MMETSP0216-20121206/8671_1 /TAXON_ID=223996 /ORGANISM="Protocruzia adherens, Strain Boccale" /LENGTH=216 /DNA_ID=CAMNT_0002349363 /DNA_START=26 /DNA_END=676 /DNA_ORIENTATION=-
MASGRLEQLAKRVETLERSIEKCGISYNQARIMAFFRQQNLMSPVWKWTPEDYYANPLEYRRGILGAASIDHLCKTIVMENTKMHPDHLDDPSYPKYIMVVVQYTSKLNAEKVMKIMRDYQNARSEKKVARKYFHYRLAPDEVSQELTGYGYNAVAPFCTPHTFPIILSKAITELDPGLFWLGGGEVLLKLGMSWQEFAKTVPECLIEDIIDDEKN